MMFYFQIAFAIINCLLFHMTGSKFSLFMGFVCAFGACLTHITTPEKDQEENDNDIF